jgi:hypothetical protein
MSSISPGGVAENGTRSGKESFARVLYPEEFCLFMVLGVANLLPCLPSLAMGLVPTGQHYSEGSDSSAERVTGLRHC